MTTRTDIHRKGAIDPNAYTLVMEYSLATTQDGWPVPSFGVNCLLDFSAQARAAGATHLADGSCCIIGMHAAGKKFAEHGSTGKCTVCGAAFIYGQVWVHAPTGEHIHIGHDCADKYDFAAGNTSFDGLRGSAIDRLVKTMRVEHFVNGVPGLKTALEKKHRILDDLNASLRSYGSLTERQVALALKISADMDRPRADEVKVAAPIKDTRQTISGEVVSVKGSDTMYGWVVKMTVKVTTPEGVWLANGTKPAGLDVERGSKVSFDARLKAGTDPSFVFFSRPTNAVVTA